MLVVMRGDQAQAQALIDWGVRNATERGEGSAIGGVLWCPALLHNGHGYHSEAIAAARQACEHEDAVFYGWALVELIEAAARGDGRPAEAAAALARLTERTQASGTEWALGTEARCRALLSDDESRYQESVERLGRSRAVVELARSRLVYGEWLRRENRRADAREQLRAAHEMFGRMGATAFAGAPSSSSSPSVAATPAFGSRRRAPGRRSDRSSSRCLEVSLRRSLRTPGRRS